MKAVHVVVAHHQRLDELRNDGGDGVAPASRAPARLRRIGLRLLELLPEAGGRVRVERGVGRRQVVGICASS